MTERETGAKIIDFVAAKARQDRKGSACDCELCILQKHSFEISRLNAKAEELERYLRKHTPNQKSPIGKLAYDQMVNSPLESIARALLNWDADGQHTTPEYTLILLTLFKEKLANAQADHVYNNPPPPDMI